MKICNHSIQHPKVNMGYFAPSYGHIRDIFYDTIEEVCFRYGIRTKIQVGNREVELYRNGRYASTIKCRSMDNPSSIVGFKIGHALIDEFDTMKMDKALHAWDKIIARMRYNIEGVRNTVDVTTTPEGFMATYKKFKEEVAKTPDLKNLYGLVQASTKENAVNLPSDYIPSLLRTYTPQLALAYLEGQFVNLKHGTVYINYDREACRSNETVSNNGDILHIGMDFNVQKMAAKIFVQRGKTYHLVDEFDDLLDTRATIQAIENRYGDKSRYRKIIYPDSSGHDRNTSNASTSDIKLLWAAGYEVRVRNTNPLIKDRVNAVNMAFERGLIKINDRTCPVAASCLEKQAYDKNGVPDKTSGHDHSNDAVGYFSFYNFPIIIPVHTIRTRGV